MLIRSSILYLSCSTALYHALNCRGVILTQTRKKWRIRAHISNGTWLIIWLRKAVRYLISIALSTWYTNDLCMSWYNWKLCNDSVRSGVARTISYYVPFWLISTPCYIGTTKSCRGATMTYVGGILWLRWTHTNHCQAYLVWIPLWLLTPKVIGAGR